MIPRLLTLFIGPVAWVATAQADFTIVQKIEGGMNTGKMTLLLKGDKARADLAPQISTITDAATGEVITLQHPAKTFVRIKPEQARQVLDQVKEQQKVTGAEPPKVEPTGQSEKVGPHDCEIFKWTAGEISATDWVAKDFSNYPAILIALEKFQQSGLAAAAAPLQPKLSSLPGMLIKREMMIGKVKTTTTLLSVSEGELADSLFVVPEGYTEQVSPAFDFKPADQPPK
ncbi:MAG: DUF4412 domain-containing protein [Chthoniobacteraceae bacterium]